MRLKPLHSETPIFKNVNKYRIDWEGKSRSKLQFAVKRFLYGYWKGQVVYEEFPVYGSQLSVDFLNATKMLAIEVNGPQHGKFNPFFHNKSRAAYRDSIMRDYRKLQWLEKNDFKLIELETEDVEQLSKEFIESKFDISLI